MTKTNRTEASTLLFYALFYWTVIRLITQQQQRRIYFMLTFTSQMESETYLCPGHLVLCFARAAADDQVILFNKTSFSQT